MRSENPLVLFVAGSAELLTSLQAAKGADAFDIQRAQPTDDIRAAIASKSPDVVVIDLASAPSDAFDLCAQIRSTPELADVGVIIVGPFADQAERRAGIDAGADDLLSAPAEGNALAERIAMICRMRKRYALAETRALCDRLLQISPNAALLVDEKGVIEHANDKARQLLGASVVGNNLAGVFEENGQPHYHWGTGANGSAERQHARGTLKLPDLPPEEVVVDIDMVATGRRSLAHISISSLQETGSISVDEDITMYDAATGVPGRALFVDRASQYFSADHQRGAIVVADIDHFGRINDAFGYGVGDQLLVACVRRIETQLGVTGQLARVGEDSFGLILQDVTNVEQMEAIAAQLSAQLERPYDIDGHSVDLTVSLGGALCSEALAVPPDTPTDPTQRYEKSGLQVLRSAELAVNAAKNNGRRQFKPYESWMVSDASRFLQVRREIRHAVVKGGWHLVYQPILDLRRQEVIGYEALARWRHPTLGDIYPDEFIPIAEETGAIVELGAWTLLEACTQLAKWRMDGSVPTTTTVAVNVSPIQVARGMLVNDVSTALRKSKLPGQNLKLELTESAMIRDTEALSRLFRQLRMMRVGINLDDFGTGYSSLSQLARLPLDAVKVDRSFVTHMNRSSREQKLVHSIIRMARTLDLEVIIEGIETEAQHETLLGQGARYGQGYLYARPLAPSVADKFLREKFMATRRSANLRSVGALNFVTTNH